MMRLLERLGHTPAAQATPREGTSQVVCTLTDAKREAVDRARIAFRDMDHNDMTMQQIEDYEAICDLLERTKTL